MAQQGLTYVGNGIQVNYSDVLSMEHGVYGGTVDTSLAAVKTLWPRSPDWKRVKREIDHIIKVGNHRNTVWYKTFYEIETPPIFYIAMEKCCTNTLQDAVVQDLLHADSYPVIMQHIARGLQHIHDNNIVLRMLKPRHILQSLDGKNIKISGFGSSKGDSTEKTDGLQKCPSYQTVAVNRMEEWASSELYNEKSVHRDTDIFSAGLIFYFILSKGGHPFGNNLFERIENIKNATSGEVNLSDAAAAHLVSQMISHTQSDRPTAEKILEHPYFWNDKKRKACAKEIQEKNLPKNLLELSGSANDLETVMMLHASSQWSQQNDGKLGLSEKVQAALKLMISPVQYKELCNVRFDPQPKRMKKSEDDVDEKNVPGIIRYESYRINVGQPLAQGKWVFECEIKEAITDNVAVKIVEHTPENLEAANILIELQGEETILAPRRVAQFNCPEYDPPPFQILVQLPVPGKAYLFFVVEKGSKSLSEIGIENHSMKYRKMLALHVVYSLEAVHAKGIAHENISRDKFILSKNKQYLKLIGSKAMSKGSANKTQEDVAAAASVLKFIAGDSKDPDWSDVLEHMLAKMTSREISAKEIPCHPFFWDVNKKLEFLEVVGNQYDSRNNNSRFESQLRVCMDKNWSEALIIDSKEKELGFAGDTQGIIYKKAFEKKNRTTLKYDHSSPIQLIRLIRNCAGHLLDDCKNDKVKKVFGYSGDQTLFKSKQDIWIFFSKRYPKLLQNVYSYVQQQESRSERLTRFFKDQRPHRPLTKIE